MIKAKTNKKNTKKINKTNKQTNKTQTNKYIFISAKSSPIFTTFQEISMRVSKYDSNKKQTKTEKQICFISAISQLKHVQTLKNLQVCIPKQSKQKSNKKQKQTRERQTIFRWTISQPNQVGSLQNCQEIFLWASQDDSSTRNKSKNKQTNYQTNTFLSQPKQFQYLPKLSENLLMGIPRGFKQKKTKKNI